MNEVKSKYGFHYKVVQTGDTWSIMGWYGDSEYWSVARTFSGQKLSFFTSEEIAYNYMIDNIERIL